MSSGGARTPHGCFRVHQNRSSIVKEPLDYKFVGVCVSAIKQCEILHYINYNTLHFRYSYNHYSLIVMDHLFNDCGIMLACNTDRLSQSLINIIQPFHE